MLRGTVLSHTAMYGTGFCTNVAVQDPQTGQLLQLRPRRPPNQPLDLTSFGYNLSNMRTHWQPGAQVDIDWAGPPAPADRRLTHPEDALFNRAACKLYSTKLPLPSFQQLALNFLASSLRDLFPPIRWQSNRKGYVEDGQVLVRSVGYVWCDRVTLVDAKTADVRTKAGESVSVAVKDRAFLAQPVGTVHADVLVRFSLANAWDGGNMNFQPERCYLMLSHVVI